MVDLWFSQQRQEETVIQVHQMSGGSVHSETLQSEYLYLQLQHTGHIQAVKMTSSLSYFLIKIINIIFQHASVHF